jgi:hypothetical protein
LKATDARDTRVVVKGKVKAEELTKISRKNKLQAFVRWAEENKVKFLKTPFTVAVIDYIEYRKSKGIGSTTLWSCDYPKLCCWGDWMAKRSICEPPNRDLIREHMPEKTAPVIEIPSWESDLESLRFWHKMRLTDMSTGLFSKRSRTYWPNWCLILVVRGLGCRPSEATALSWETVELDRNCVRFLRSKNDRSRRVPILFQWVRDGLTEAWERAGRPTSGPVCLNSRGTLWEHDSSACSQMKALCDHHHRPVYQLKKAQKLFISHAIRLGFPPHVIAHWTDHTLTVQERHCYEGDGYLPPEDGWDYQEFGTLSEYGSKAKAHTDSYSKDIDTR